MFNVLSSDACLGLVALLLVGWLSWLTTGVFTNWFPCLMMYVCA